uniref:UBA domain containing 2 n=1 Tax=Seriola lalandi dorsalis TaxID=1841481 RepID=A0A3B4XNA1_SERLL
MFTTTGSRGLYKAPLSKGLLLVLNGLTVMLTLLPQYQELFVYNLQAVTHQHQVWRLLCGRLVCLDVKDSFCSSLLIYNFRIFERRFGTRKFAFEMFIFLFLSVSLFVHVISNLCTYLHFSSHRLAPVFSLFVPFYLSIPRMPVTQVLGHIHITNKSLVYIVGLQVSPCSAGVSMCVYIFLCPSEFLRMRCFFVFSSPPAVDFQPLHTPLGMGATLDIQRQQKMDLLDQQLLLAQYNEARRNTRQQPQPGLLQWTRLFPSLRHRGQNRPPMQPRPQAQTQPSTHCLVFFFGPQVARLVEMGFSRTDALEALRASNNDINMATNFLLQH